MKIQYYSTNNKNLKVSFKTALLEGLAPDYGLYMIARKDIPKLNLKQIKEMKNKNYAEIAFDVLNPFLNADIPERDLRKILNKVYDEHIIPTKVQHVSGKTYIMWLGSGPTHSFKDYAARFFGKALNYFLEKNKQKRIVIVATSGDTGGAVADALYKQNNVDNIVFFPKGLISEQQRRQMTTLGKNIYAFAVNGDFDVCQELAKKLLGDKEFAYDLFKDRERFTSANSISLGRLLPQIVYPFYAYSRASNNSEEMIAGVPSGNFGDMMGTVIAKEMGLPISKILCGVNENMEFPIFLKTGRYNVNPTKVSPSTAMNISHPSNLIRLVDFYGGYMYDERDPNGKMIKLGMIDKMPNLEAMRRDIFSISVNNEQHYKIMKGVYRRYKVIIDPHGAVAWRALEIYLRKKHNRLSIVYETADPGKFSEDVKKAIGKYPKIPEGIRKQDILEERIYEINSEPDIVNGSKRLSTKQYNEAKEIISRIYS